MKVSSLEIYEYNTGFYNCKESEGGWSLQLRGLRSPATYID